MAENTNTNTTQVPESLKGENVKPVEPPKPEEVKPLTAEELKAMFDSLPDMFKTAVSDINGAIDAHNKNIAAIKKASTSNPTVIKAEIFEQNPDNNEKLATLRKQELKLLAQVETIRKQAYEVIDKDGLMPKDLTEEEVTKLKTEASETQKTLREQVSALTAMEAMMPVLKGKVTPLIHEIQTQRGGGIKSSSGGKTGDGPKRPRFKKIEVNGVTSDANGNTVYGVVDGVEKYTFSLTSAYLRKQAKGITWSANDLQAKYYEGEDENNLPEVKEFVMPYTYKDENGNEHTVNYTVKTYK